MEILNENIHDRKNDHIELLSQSQSIISGLDNRFFYEPLLGSHPENHSTFESKIFNKTIKAPLWISSMTGGGTWGKIVNKRLAKMAKKYSLGMGLGSCRILLEEESVFCDFDVRKDIGDDLPFFANLGISQLENYYLNKNFAPVFEMCEKLNVDGLIIHVNPLQEYIQKEGDTINVKPIETIKAFRNQFQKKVVVKEVGQGMGPKSLKALFEIGVDGIELGAFGGTNFSTLERLRTNSKIVNEYEKIGHGVLEMISFLNSIECKKSMVPEIIISGGIRSFLDGYYYINKCNLPAVYGQARCLIEKAMQSEEDLDIYINEQIKGFQFAQNILTVK